MGYSLLIYLVLAVLGLCCFMWAFSSCYGLGLLSWVRKIRWRRDSLPTLVFLGFPCGSAGKESTCNAGDQGSIPGLGGSPGEGKGCPLQYSGLENAMDCVVRGDCKELDMTK